MNEADFNTKIQRLEALKKIYQENGKKNGVWFTAFGRGSWKDKEQEQQEYNLLVQELIDELERLDKRRTFFGRYQNDEDQARAARILLACGSEYNDKKLAEIYGIKFESPENQTNFLTIYKELFPDLEQPKRISPYRIQLNLPQAERMTILQKMASRCNFSIHNTAGECIAYAQGGKLYDSKTKKEYQSTDTLGFETHSETVKPAEEQPPQSDENGSSMRP